MRVCYLGRRSGRRNSAPEGTGEQASPVSVLELRRGRRSHVPRRRRPPLHPSRVPYHEPCGCESFTQCLRRQVRRCFLQGRYTNRAQFRATSPPPPDLRFILAAGKPGKHWGSCERRLSQKQRTENGEHREQKNRRNRGFHADAAFRTNPGTPASTGVSGRREKGQSNVWPSKSGGEDEDRTHDLRIANAALSQLSYPPTRGAKYSKKAFQSIGERLCR